MSITFSYPTVHRIPNPDGRGIKITAEALGLTSGALSETFNAGSLGYSVPTRGIWANADLTSVTTSGYLARLGLANLVENTLVFTEFGPLTRGRGDGSLAELEDVTVVVNGSEVTPLAVDPLAGIIILDGVLSPGDDVLLDYHYLPRLTIPFAELNNSNYLLNQYNDPYLHPFEFNTVLTADPVKDQPQIVEHRWTAFDYDYTAVLNDPTSLVLNEPVTRDTLTPFQRDLTPTSVFFEGDDHPSEFTFVGDALGAASFSADGLYLVEDASTGTDNASGQPALFRKTVDLSYEAQSLLSWRTRVESYTTDGVFTGISVGYADDENAYLAGFLELSGSFKTIGALSDAGDEARVESWSGVSATVEDNGGALDLLRFDDEPPLIVGQRLWSSGVIYTVLDIDDEGAAGYTVTVDTVFPAAGEINLFVEFDWEVLTTYRARREEDASFEVFAGGLPTPVASVTEEAAAIAPEIFALLRNSSIFFGSASRRATSLTAWDFVRYSIVPDQGTETSSSVSVDTDMSVLPEEASPPWYVAQNQGYATTLSGGFVLQQAAGRDADGLGYNWARIEPFLTTDVTREVRARLRVSSWAGGLANTLIIADDKRQATVSLFEDAPSAAFLSSYVGVTSPTDAGFTSTLDSGELDYLDHRLLITHDGAAATAVQDGFDATTNWKGQVRFLLTSYALDANDVVPFYFGVDDGDKVLYLAPFDDGTKQLILVDSSGLPVLDAGSPVGVTYDWDLDTLQAIKLVRLGDNLTVFADGIYLGLIDALLAPNSSRTDLETRFGFLSGQVTVELDYFYVHQASHGTRRVGLLTNGTDVLDSSLYEAVDAEFLGSFLEVRVRVDPTSTVDLFLGGSITPSISIPYTELPLREEQTNVDTEFGFLQFGTLDPEAFTETHWDSVDYDLVNQREDQRTNQTAILNYSNTLTSPEPTIDDSPEVVTVQPYTLTEILLSETGMFADRVLSVTSSDGLTSLGYTFDKDSNTITLDSPLASLDESVIVTFYHDAPYTKAYLENNQAAIRLGESTPPFALSHQANVTSAVEFDSQLNDITDTLNSDVDFVLNDEGRSVVFRRDPDSFLSCLNLCTEVASGSSGLVSPACDQSGFRAITLEDPYEEEYTFADNGDQNTRHRGRVLRLNDLSSTLNSPEANTLCLASPVTIECEQVEEETYAGAGDEALTGGTSVLTDYYGSSLLNNPKATLNSVTNTPGDVYEDSVIFSANDLTTSDVILDFASTVYFP